MVRILVLEDDPSLGRLLRQLLEGWGHAVEFVRDAVAAHELALAEPESTFLVDYPLDGAALPQDEARARAALAAVAGPARVIYMTSHPASPAAGSAYVVKPFGSSELLTALQRSLRRQSRA